MTTRVFMAPRSRRGSRNPPSNLPRVCNRRGAATPEVDSLPAVDQVVQIAGALLILAAFVLAQRRRLDTSSTVYLVLNTVGAAALAIVAYLDRDWGFVLLEGVWALVSGWALVAGRPRAG